MLEVYPVRWSARERNASGEFIRHGGCSCGAVRFETKGEPSKVGICHCTECRKATGAAFVSYADWPRNAFTFTGEVRTYHGRSFCPACGSRVFHLSDDVAEIMLGALDDVPSGLTPTREGWIERREPWVHPVAGAVQYAADPADPPTLTDDEALQLARATEAERDA